MHFRSNKEDRHYYIDLHMDKSNFSSVHICVCDMCEVGMRVGVGVRMRDGDGCAVEKWG